MKKDGVVSSQSPRTAALRSPAMAGVGGVGGGSAAPVLAHGHNGAAAANGHAADNGNGQVYASHEPSAAAAAPIPSPSPSPRSVDGDGGADAGPQLTGPLSKQQWREGVAVRLHVAYYLAALCMCVVGGHWEMLPATTLGLVASMVYMGTSDRVAQVLAGLYIVAMSVALASNPANGRWRHVMGWVPRGDYARLTVLASLFIRLPLTLLGLASVLLVVAHWLEGAGAGPRAYAVRAVVYLMGVYVDVLQVNDPAPALGVVMAAFSCFCILVTVVPQSGGATAAHDDDGGGQRGPTAGAKGDRGWLAGGWSAAWQRAMAAVPSLTRGRPFYQAVLRVGWCGLVGFRVAVASTSTGLEWLVGMCLLLWALTEGMALSSALGVGGSLLALLAAAAAGSDSVVLGSIVGASARHGGVGEGGGSRGCLCR